MVTRIVAVAAALLLSAPATARAVPIINFDFVSPVTVSPLDTVTIQVEITNTSTAGESVTGTLASSFSFGTIPSTYTFTFARSRYECVAGSSDPAALRHRLELDGPIGVGARTRRSAD